jgi:tRNA(fMet)-specific endonuclease VapC
MRVCIDTNIYSLLKTGDKIILELLEKADEILIPAIVLGELFAGFYPGKHTAGNIKELEEFLNKPGITVVDINKETADRYGELVKILKTKGTPLPTNDVWIAAVALETGAKLISLDKHFQAVPGIFNVMEKFR